MDVISCPLNTGSHLSELFRARARVLPPTAGILTELTYEGFLQMVSFLKGQRKLFETRCCTPAVSWAVRACMTSRGCQLSCPCIARCVCSIMTLTPQGNWRKHSRGILLQLCALNSDTTRLARLQLRILPLRCFPAANIFGQLSYKGFIARCSVSRCSQRICPCVIRICSILNSTLQGSAELRASLNYPSQLPSGGVCACFAFIRSRQKL